MSTDGHTVDEHHRMADDTADTRSQDRDTDRWKVVAGEHSRPIELTEASILQGFRPDYPWSGHKTARFRQIGNAVPPGLGAAVLAVAAGLSTTHLSLAA